MTGDGYAMARQVGHTVIPAEPALCALVTREKWVTHSQGLSLKNVRAIVTSGGVRVKEIEPKTMASKLAGGLFFAGEVIYVDVETGGFNLQAAFPTGFTAGDAAAKYAMGDEDE